VAPVLPHDTQQTLNQTLMTELVKRENQHSSSQAMLSLILHQQPISSFAHVNEAFQTVFSQI